eukprot:gene15178-biopygen8359
MVAKRGGMAAWRHTGGRVRRQSLKSCWESRWQSWRHGGKALAATPAKGAGKRGDMEATRGGTAARQHGGKAWRHGDMAAHGGINDAVGKTWRHGGEAEDDAWAAPVAAQASHPFRPAAGKSAKRRRPSIASARESEEKKRRPSIVAGSKEQTKAPPKHHGQPRE